MKSPYDDGIKWDRFFCEPGESCDRTVEFRIRSIYIDNFSDSWLYLPDLARFIPPLTLGWQANYNGPTTRLRVDASDAPPGGIESSNTGGKVLIDVFSESKGESFGTTLGSVSNQAQAQQILVSALTFTPDGTSQQHIAGVANKSIVVLSWNLRAIEGPLPPIAPTGNYDFGLFSNTGLGMTLGADDGLWGDIDRYPYGVSLVVGTDLTMIAHSSDGSLPVFISLVRYYFSES